MQNSVHATSSRITKKPKFYLNAIWKNYLKTWKLNQELLVAVPLLLFFSLFYIDNIHHK